MPAATFSIADIDRLRDDPDDAVHRELAERLRKAGDPRGELIESQCERARLADTTPRAAELWRREVKLMRAHENAWLRPLGLRAGQATFSRGFVTTIEMTLPQLMDAKANLGELAPIDTVVLRGPRPKLTGALSFLGGDDDEDDDDEDSDDESVAALVRARWFRHVRTLKVERGAASRSVVRALAAARELETLRSLALELASLDPKPAEPAAADDVAALLASPALAGLRSFRLRADDLAPYVDVIASSKLRVRELQLVGRGLRDDGVLRLLAADQLFVSVERLSLESELGPAAVEALASSNALGKLASLSLSGNQAIGSGALALANARSEHLVELDLSYTGITGKAALELIDALRGRLRHLSLVGNELTEAEIKRGHARAGSLAIRFPRIGYATTGVLRDDGRLHVVFDDGTIEDVDVADDVTPGMRVGTRRGPRGEVFDVFPDSTKA